MSFARSIVRGKVSPCTRESCAVVPADLSGVVFVDVTATQESLRDVPLDLGSGQWPRLNFDAAWIEGNAADGQMGILYRVQSRTEGGESGTVDVYWLKRGTKVYTQSHRLTFSLQSGRPLDLNLENGCATSQPKEIEDARLDFVSTPWRLAELLDCKNLALEQEEPRSKPALRTGRTQLRPLGLRWHRLVILPGMKARKSLVVEPGSGETFTRLHLQRGHMKTYGPERPLFGKYAGRFWWAPHARGNKERGVVLKDYEVRAQ